MKGRKDNKITGQRGLPVWRAVPGMRLALPFALSGLAYAQTASSWDQGTARGVTRSATLPAVNVKATCASASGKTVIAVSHDDRYFDAAERVIQVSEGRVVADLGPAPTTSDEAESA